MDYTKKDCIKWSKNRELDPVTGSRIEPGSYIYSRMVDLCKYHNVMYTGRKPENYIPKPNYRSFSDALKPSLNKIKSHEPTPESVQEYNYNPGCYTGKYKTVISKGVIKKIPIPPRKKTTGINTL